MCIEVGVMLINGFKMKEMKSVNMYVRLWGGKKELMNESVAKNE